jgi:hypothetical protein
MSAAASRRGEHDLAPATSGRARLGGTEGNERLTIATAAVLALLLAAEGVTVVHMRGLVSVHMFIGFVLIPPILLKLSSTGYRFLRYYGGSVAYRAKGPPQPALRLLAPVLAACTAGVFVSGVLLLSAGHKAGLLLEIHKVCFIVWVAMFAVHFLAYLPRVAWSLTTRAPASRRPRPPPPARRRPSSHACVGRGRWWRCPGDRAAPGHHRLAHLTRRSAGPTAGGSRETRNTPGEPPDGARPDGRRLTA